MFATRPVGRVVLKREVTHTQKRAFESPKPTYGSSQAYWSHTIFYLATGKSTRIPLEYLSDFHHLKKAKVGKIVVE